MPDTFTPEQISQILEEFFKVVGTRQYIGARYVPLFGRKDEESIEWDNTAPYEPLTIVLYQGNSYTSRQYVPVGVEITNQEFWAITGNYNAQVEMYRRETAAAKAAADAAQESADNAQNDIDVLLPKNAFSADNTVKQYIEVAKAAADAAQESADNAQNDIDVLLPKNAFSADNTVKQYIDDVAASASNVSNMYKFMKKGCYQFATVIGHQGTSTMCPGNTPIAYELANKFNVDAFETDIQLTSDDDFVCMHDFTLESYCNLTGSPANYTLETLKATPITIGNYVDSWPTQYFMGLDDFIAICKKYAKIAVIELKTQTISAEFVRKAIDKIKSLGYYDNTILIGTTYIETVREVDTKIPYMLVASNYSTSLVDHVASYGGGLALNISAYTNDAYDYCKLKNVPLNLWVYNSVTNGAFESNYKCDFVTTDNIMALNAMPAMTLSDIANNKTVRKAHGFVAKTEFAKDTIANGILAGVRVNGSAPHNIIPTENGITIPKRICSENIMRVNAPKIVSEPMRTHQIGVTQYNESDNIIADTGYMTNYPSDYAYTYPLFVNNKVVHLDFFYYLQNIQQAIFANDFCDCSNIEFVDTGLTLVYQPNGVAFNSNRPALRQTNFVGPNKLYKDKAIVTLADDVTDAYVFVSWYGFDADMKRNAAGTWARLTKDTPVTVTVPSGSTYVQPYINVFQDENHATQHPYISGAMTPWFQVLNNISFSGF